MRIAGIDPGYHRCGWAVLEITRAGGMLHGSGTIVAEAGQDMARRLNLIAEGIDQLISLWQPDVMAVEELFFVKNVKTGIGVAQARGVVLQRAAAAGIRVEEYPPSMIKNQLTGSGNADKKQVEYMVRRLFEMPDDNQLDDELDAIAVAVCQAMRSGIPEQLR
ncbi:crossover junction endodeoxyribonuclease RuvC [bacterium]|nr:crossover junction endodeoxyribonuclease RuvC [bacterium]